MTTKTTLPERVPSSARDSSQSSCVRASPSAGFCWFVEQNVMSQHELSTKIQRVFP
jgi:hypothetical protein